MKPRDLLALIVLAALWGGSFMFIRVAVPSFGPAMLVAARVAIGALFLWIIISGARRPIALRAHTVDLLVLGAINAAIPYTLISAAEIHLTASVAAVLNATAPLCAALLGVVWLGERLTTARVAGLIVGICGVSLMVGWSPVPLTRSTIAAAAAMIAASASYAAAGIYAKRRLAGVSIHSLALGQQLGALALLAVPALVWRPSTAPPAAATWAVFSLGVLSTGVAYLLYFHLLERVGPTKTATVTYLLPVFGMLWGALFLGERVTIGMLAGFAMILASVVLVNGVRIPAFPARFVPRKSAA